MSNGDLLLIDPLELQFPFELKKQISCSMQLTNKSDEYVAFKVKTTNPKKYCVRPNTGVVIPRSSCDVIVTMQAQKEAPPDMQCRDKFLLQSVVVRPGIASKDITPEMFNKDSGNNVDECKLKVTYVPPPQPPSPVREGSEEGSSPRASVSDNGTVNQTPEFNIMSKPFSESRESIPEVISIIFCNLLLVIIIILLLVCKDILTLASTSINHYSLQGYSHHCLFFEYSLCICWLLLLWTYLSLLYISFVARFGSV
ncbi:vesicle-associated protein 1-2-like isoform X1 [Primulina tabacum]|uniref:vesicle-associated protein 1-2-like isoform X1 n=1 Tax=Primulina tabacum TaxID=48773 RepID=UPI003F59CA23